MSGDDAWVRRFELLWGWVQVLVGRHELALVVGATVTDYDLGRVLVGHDDGGRGKSASLGVRVVPLEGLPGHAGVQVLSHLILIPAQNAKANRGCFSQERSGERSG